MNIRLFRINKKFFYSEIKRKKTDERTISINFMVVFPLLYLLKSKKMHIYIGDAIKILQIYDIYRFSDNNQMAVEKL